MCNGAGFVIHLNEGSWCMLASGGCWALCVLLWLEE